MVLIVHVNAEHVAHTRRKIWLFGEKIRFFTALDRIKCLKQTKEQRLLVSFSPISELPSEISTMIFIYDQYIL